MHSLTPHTRTKRLWNNFKMILEPTFQFGFIDTSKCTNQTNRKMWLGNLKTKLVHGHATYLQGSPQPTLARNQYSPPYNRLYNSSLGLQQNVHFLRDFYIKVLKLSNQNPTTLGAHNFFISIQNKSS